MGLVVIVVLAAGPTVEGEIVLVDLWSENVLSRLASNLFKPGPDRLDQRGSAPVEG